jgi:putative intracellular protease/amidase
MSQPTAYVFIFEGFADWEPASALAELRRSFGFNTKAVALGRDPVTSMGGLRVIPDLTLAEFEPQQAEILILPGGDSWMAGEKPEMSKALGAMASASRPVAGICAATLALAHAGLLDDRLHTSNGADFIGKYVPGYRGAQLYRAAPAVSDRGVISASGVAPIAFAAQIFRTLAPDRAGDITSYEALYARGLIE